MSKLFQGCGTALVTPFHEDGTVDFEAYAALVDRQVAGGVDFLVPLATTAETPALTSEEKVRLLDITREHAGSLPLLVGAGSNSVPGTLANMQLLESHGATGWLVVVPFYNKPNQEGQYRYFCEIARLSSLPIVIYNVPGRTGANMTAQTCLRIARDCPNVVGVKEASGKMDQVLEILSGVAADASASLAAGASSSLAAGASASLYERFSVLSGDDDMTLDMMKNGADGVISVASNIAPSRLSAMIRAAASAAAAGVATSAGSAVAAAASAAVAGVATSAGSAVAAAASAAVAAAGGAAGSVAGSAVRVAANVWAAAEEIDSQLQPLYKACFVEPNPIPAKAALNLLGLCSDAMRLPLVPATDQTRALMASLLSETE